MAYPLTIAIVGRPDAAYEGLLARRCGLLRPFSRVDVVRVKAVSVGAGSAVPAACEQEARRLTAACPSASWLVGLWPDGVLRDSAGFASWLGGHMMAGRRLAFLIGGAYGLAPSLRNGCRERVSLSPLTLPHDMALLVLLEQLYRAFTILAGHPYHK